jgi:long-chain acyl-CoA synthetase
MSELTCVATINPPERIKIGTVGPPIPGVELRLAGDGEVLIRGDIVMPGYRNQPEKTADTIDAAGWLHTGDIGTLDEDGYLTIVDRKKELIINAAGKNMSPANIEAALKTASPLIGQACVIGDRRPYNVALIVLDPDGTAAFADGNDVGDEALGAVAEAEAIVEAVTEGVRAANERLSRVEQIKRFRILEEDWEPGGDELTPTMKLKRRPIAEKYAEEIEALYAEA